MTQIHEMSATWLEDKEGRHLVMTVTSSRPADRQCKVQTPFTNNAFPL